jgi:hypothetical protein
MDKGFEDLIKNMQYIHKLRRPTVIDALALQAMKANTLVEKLDYRPNNLHSTFISSVFNDIHKMSLKLSPIITKEGFIPKSIIDNLILSHKHQRIFDNQYQIFKKFEGLASIVEQQAKWKQLHSINTAFNTLVSSLALNLDEESEELQTIDELTQSALQLASGTLSTEELNAIRSLVNTHTNSTTVNVDRQISVASLIVAFLSLVFAALSYIQSLSPLNQSNTISQIDYSNFKADVLSSYDKAISQNGIRKQVNTDVPLYAKETIKSTKICTITKGTIVTVVNFNENWAYVTYENIDGELPIVCGWISTKFFCKNVLSNSFRERQRKNAVGR